MLKSIEISGLLSFAHAKLDLKPLNVLIGPNGSGKSNLIAVLTLLKALPLDLIGVMRQGGGPAEWIWSGNNGNIAKLTIHFDGPGLPPGTITDRYMLELENRLSYWQIKKEFLVSEWDVTPPEGMAPMEVLVDLDYGKGKIQGEYPIGPDEYETRLSDIELGPGSIFQLIRANNIYPSITQISQDFSTFRYYRELNFGYNSPQRRPQPVDAPMQFLEEDARNLVLIINSFERDGTIKRLEEELREFYENAERINMQIVGNMAQLFLTEKGFRNSVPATRLSDGTIRYLCLLAILLHPNPPPLVCIEEPELGLHPDVLPRVAELMKEASERMQLIVTTHSDILIDALSDTPESVVVCERSLEDGGTEFKRLEPNKLSGWLEDYRLGHLWRKGEIGGNRW